MRQLISAGRKGTVAGTFLALTLLYLSPWWSFRKTNSTRSAGLIFTMSLTERPESRGTTLSAPQFVVIDDLVVLAFTVSKKLRKFLLRVSCRWIYGLLPL